MDFRSARFGRKPTFPYPKEHTIWLEHLGNYYPEPNWKRWLSPFHHKTPQNAFRRGITVNKLSPHPPVFFGELSRAVKRRLGRGYRVGVLTPNHKFYTKVSVKCTDAGPEAFMWSYSMTFEDGHGSGQPPWFDWSETSAGPEAPLWSYSMTFEDGHGYWESCGFDWGKTINLEIWILLQRRPDQPISRTSITFLIQEPTSHTHGSELVQRHLSLQIVWPRFSEAVSKYNQIYKKRYGIPLPADIINDFRANFRYNILGPYREYIYSQHGLDDWGFQGRKSRGFYINGKQRRMFSHNVESFKILRDPSFVDGYTKTLQTFQMIGSDLAITPWAMSIWEVLQEFLNSKFKQIGVKNWDVMFGNHTKQDDRFEGNVSEVASFAISGNSRSNDLVAIDPAIETTTYSVFLESIQDLPFKLNQWCQVVRRESKPIPFIRGLQFPCQKAYSATKTEVEAEIRRILELYRHFFEEMLAVPIIKCKTSELEKFAVEVILSKVLIISKSLLIIMNLPQLCICTMFKVFLPNVAWSSGCGSLTLPGACCIPGAIAHCLGQKVLENLNKNRKKATAWLNTWSCSIRVIGLMVMVHGNENGLVLPPKVAPTQVIVTSRHNICDSKIRDRCIRVVAMLCDAGVCADAVLDNFQSPEGCWEDKGVPLLIKVVGLEQAEAHRRDNKEIISLSISSMFGRSEMVSKVKGILDEIQESLFKAAKWRQDACIQTVKNWDEFVEAVRNMRVILAPWCDEEVVEKDVKAKLGLMSRGYGVKILCSPLDQSGITEDTKCFASGKPAKKWTYWGRNLLDEF